MPAVLNGRKVSGNDKCKFYLTHFGSSFQIQSTINSFIDSMNPWKRMKTKKKKQAKVALLRFFVNLTINVCLYLRLRANLVCNEV